MAFEPANVPLSLYVHIPWCERKCPYCDFNSHESMDQAIEGPYVTSLLEDLRQQLAFVRHRPLRSIFIGGGTPSLFSGSAIGQLLSGIDQLLTLPASIEITLESNPGSAEAARYRDYRAAGVNRLSIGVQSFHDDLLQRLGRIHSADEARKATDLADSLFERFNIDLMHGLPDQSPTMAHRDLEEGIQRCGDHLSWYQLTIEPNTVFWSEPPQIPVEDALACIQDDGEALLADRGFERYEVSAWCRPGQASLHNLNYWQFGDYIGIGAGAHGKITRADGVIQRSRRSRLPRDYMASIQAGGAPILETVATADLPGEFMMNALRLAKGVPTSLFTERTGLTIDGIAPVLERLKARGLLAEQGLGASPTGFRFLNDVVGAFIDH